VTDGVWAPGQWNYQGYLARIRRCLLNTLVLMISLFVLAVLVIWFNTHAAAHGSRVDQHPPRGNRRASLRASHLLRVRVNG